MGFADERQHVVLAQGEEFDVLHDDHVVVGFLEQGALDDGFPVLEISLGEELHGLRYALRSFDKALPLYILSEELQDGLDVRGDFVCGVLVVFFYFPVCHGLFFVAVAAVKMDCKNSEKIP